MNQADNSRPVDPLQAFLFTNSGGNIIFSDHRLLGSVGEKAARLLSGESLPSFLRLDFPSSDKLIENIRQASVLENLLTSYETATGETVKAYGTFLAAFGENGDFLGMDIVLTGKSLEASQTKILAHSDVIQGYVEMEMNSRDVLQPRTFIQSYIVTQFNALQILLARIGGPSTQPAFEKLINNMTRLMGLPILMTYGNLKFLKRDFDIQVYRRLLQTGTDYAVNVVGKNIVKQEMLLVDKSVGRGTLDLISQMDLRIFSAE